MLLAKLVQNLTLLLVYHVKLTMFYKIILVFLLVLQDNIQFQINVKIVTNNVKSALDLLQKIVFLL